MFAMMNKIVKSLNSVNSFSKRIIVTGSLIALFLCIAGMILIGYNTIISQKVQLYTLGSTMIQTAIVLFVQIVIGGLIIDFFSNMVNNHND